MLRLKVGCYAQHDNWTKTSIYYIYTRRRQPNVILYNISHNSKQRSLNAAATSVEGSSMIDKIITTTLCDVISD